MSSVMPVIQCLHEAAQRLRLPAWPALPALPCPAAGPIFLAVQALQGFGGRVAPFETATALFGWFMVSGGAGRRAAGGRWRVAHACVAFLVCCTKSAALLLPTLEKRLAPLLSRLS